jgi:prolyl-tRNA editing enzyme YbaK/EbsC (Cys-tRNA(Pro) deacylase)
LARGSKALSTSLAGSARKVQEAAASLGLAVSVRDMPASTRTAADAAAACGVGAGQIIKSLVFLGERTGTPYLLLVSGANRVDEKGIARHLGEELRRPTAEAVRELTGFAIGGIPPFGHARKLTTYLDADLLQYPVVWAAAGTPNAVFSVDPSALRDAVGAPAISV